MHFSFPIPILEFLSSISIIFSGHLLLFFVAFFIRVESQTPCSRRSSDTLHNLVHMQMIIPDLKEVIVGKNNHHQPALLDSSVSS